MTFIVESLSVFFAAAKEIVLRAGRQESQPENENDKQKISFGSRSFMLISVFGEVEEFVSDVRAQKAA
jgi:hypothetical protein